MSADWFAKKLAGGRPTPPQHVQPSYPQGPPPPQHLQPVPQSQQPQVTQENIAQVAGLWQGGEATKKETAACPHCGGDHFFSVQNAPGSRVATQNGMVSAAPRCYDCGYTTRHGMQTGAMS